MENRDAQRSYDAHARMEEAQADGTRMPACFTAPDSVDAWRHRRMHEMLRPLIATNPAAKWITLGDGSYGSDAYFLQQQGVDVLASSLTDHSLRISAEKGFLKKYAAVNAEEIPYEDGAFDFVLCKEAYHHFPRPAIAFYEMLRVAKEAVVLIEPYDGPERFLDMIKEPMKKLLWGKTQTIHFEPSGNFIYRIHPKEKGKKLAAMGYAAVAHKTFNDIYLPKYGTAKEGNTKGHLATKLAIFLQDILCALRLLNPGLVTVVSFKQMPPEELIKEMKRAGFSFDVLPVNPYETIERDG
jgi:ubiquinone/menaquinone biosynthesis C-methylase UbiE